MTLVADLTGTHLYAGGADGAVHVINLAKATSSAGQQGLSTLGSHLASVLCMDVCTGSPSQPATLATGSEDGMVRVWDVHAAQHCKAILCPSQPTALPLNLGVSQLAAARSGAAVTALRWQDNGAWLVCGLAGSTPALATWSIDGSDVPVRAVYEELPCIPQVLALQPGEVLVAGNAPTLYRYTFTGQQTMQHELSPCLRSVFALDVMSGSAGSGGRDGQKQPVVAPGGVAVGGAGGTVEVLSCYGTRLMSTGRHSDEGNSVF